MYTLEHLNLDEAQSLCHEIVQDLPQYFAMPGMNESYSPGMHTRTNLAVKHQDRFIGLLGLEYPYPENAHIYWMGVSPTFHRQGLGTLLLQEAFLEAQSKGAQTMSVETLAPLEGNMDYLKTYAFYKKSGFKPLFDLQATNYQFMMVHMVKCLRHHHFL